MKKLVVIFTAAVSALLIFNLSQVFALELKDPNSILPDAQKIFIETVPHVLEGSIMQWKNEIRENKVILAGVKSQAEGLIARNAYLREKIEQAILFGLDPNQ